MRRTIVVIAVWVLATAAPAACTKSKAPPRTATTTATATATPSASVGMSDAKADLDAALLTLADMPAGYAPNTEAGPDYSVMSTCTEEAVALDGYHKDAQAKTGTAFSTASGRLVVQSLALLSGHVENNTLAALKKALTRCTEWRIDQNTYTLSKTGYGPYGEETVSYRVAVKSEVPFILDVVFFRKENLLVGVMVVNAGRASTKDVQNIFDIANRKLPKQ